MHTGFFFAQRGTSRFIPINVLQSILRTGCNLPFCSIMLTYVWI